MLPNSHYEFSAMVKLLNQSDFVLGETVDMIWNYEGALILDNFLVKLDKSNVGACTLAASLF